MKSSNCHLHSYTGHAISVKGETDISLGKSKSLHALVVEGVNDTPLLIGADTLRKAGSAVDFTSRTVSILGQQYPMIARTETPDAVSYVEQLPNVTSITPLGIRTC